MKHTLLVPIRFLLVALAVLLVVTLLAAAVDQGSGAGGQEAAGTRTFMRSVLLSLPVTLPASILGAIPIQLLLILRNPGRPAGSLLLLFVTAAAFQYAAGTLLEPPEPTDRELGLFQPGLILETPEYAFAFRGRSGSAVTGVLLERPREDPVLSVHREGFIDLAGRRLLLPESGVSLPLEADYAPSASLYRPPAVIAGFVSDVLLFVESLGSPRGGLDYLLLLASTTLLFFSLWTFARATNWKLMNLILLWFAVRLFFLLFRLLRSDLVTSLAEQQLPESLASYLTPGVVTVLALLLLLLAILMPPLKEWKRGVGDA
ncbi:MAG: hypothetical protein ACOC28_02610 [Alkalispirochaetaceae bacterium]